MASGKQSSGRDPVLWFFLPTFPYVDDIILKTVKNLVKIVFACSVALVVPTLTHAQIIEFVPPNDQSLSESGEASRLSFDVAVNVTEFGVPCIVSADIQTVLIEGTANAQQGSDYTLSTTTVTIPIDDDPRQSVTVNAINDNIAEPVETIGLRLVNPRATGTCNATLGDNATTTFTIVDDPLSQAIQTLELTPLADNSIIEDQNGASAHVDIEVTMNNPDFGGPCTIEADIIQIPSENGPDATPGEDYNLPANTVTFDIPDSLPTTLSQTMTIDIFDDQNEEVPENLWLQLSNFRVAPDTNQGEVQCSVTGGENILVSMIIKDGLTSNREAIILSGAPGTTVVDSFIVTGGWDDISVVANNNQATVTAVRLESATPAWQVTYSFILLSDAPVGDTIEDLITITGSVQDGVVALANPTAVPVIINVIFEPSRKLTTTDTAWQQLCENAQDPELIQRCEATLVATGIYALSTQQEKDISPEEYAAMGTGSIEMTKNQLKTIFYQQLARRQGITGLDLNRLTMTLEGQIVPIGQLIDSSLDKASGGNAGEAQRGPWSLFVSGRVNSGKKSGTDYDAGYEFDTNGITAGADYLINNQSFIGAALGYAAMDSTFGHSGGDLDIESKTFTLYSSYFRSNDVYIDGSLTYGPYHYQFNRNITSFSAQTTGNADGNQWALSLTAGRDYYRKSVMASPYLRLDYIDASIDAYQEQGGSGLALNIEKQDIESMTTALGGRFSYTNSMSWGVLMPSAHLEWVHEYKDDSRTIVASFVANPGPSFSTPVDEVDKDYLNIGLGISANFPQGRVVYLQYETAAEQNHFTTHTLHLGARMDL